MDKGTAIALLSREAFGHTHTATPDWYAACAMAVDALINQQFRERKGDYKHAKTISRRLEILE